mmetsp:Transcript_145945/g.269179  ORF Transcript_145945/g.269179 Transcript_145945/m.269179 type:complete len:87 (-) Transcript_145945:105-365(-)
MQQGRHCGHLRPATRAAEESPVPPAEARDTQEFHLPNCARIRVSSACSKISRGTFCAAAAALLRRSCSSDRLLWTDRPTCSVSHPL